MSMKGTIQPDHMPLNKYQLVILPGVVLDFTTVAGLESELDTVQLPDRTVATGGRRKTVKFTARLPAHHTVQQVFMEEWFQEATDPVAPTYKRPCTLIMQSLSGTAFRAFTMPDVFPTKRKAPDFEMMNPGDMAEIEWSFEASDMLPI